MSSQPNVPIISWYHSGLRPMAARMASWAGRSSGAKTEWSADSVPTTRIHATCAALHTATTAIQIRTPVECHSEAIPRRPASTSRSATMRPSQSKESWRESARTTAAIPTCRTSRPSGSVPAATSSTSTAPEAQSASPAAISGPFGFTDASRNSTIGVSAPRKPRSRRRDDGPRRRLATAEARSAAMRATVTRRIA